MDHLLAPASPHICKGCGATPTTLCDSCYINYTNQHYNCCLYCSKKLPTGCLCVDCRKRHGCFNNLLATFERRGPLARLVGDYKYNSEIASSPIIARLLAEAITARYDGIVYIPTIARHKRVRGFDHMEQVARQLSRRINCPVGHRILYRTDNLVQHEQNWQDRQKKIASSIACHQVDLSGQYLLLIDDIWTTGATLSTAARLLVSLGATVDGAVVLRQPDSKNKKAIR